MADKPPLKNSVATRFSDLPDSVVDSPKYNEIIDDYTTAGYTYFCEARIGIAASVAEWRISRYRASTGELMWADGDSNFDNVAADRAALTYSFT